MFPFNSPQVSGALLIEQGVQCINSARLKSRQSCLEDEFTPVQLPAFQKRWDTAEHEVTHFRFTVGSPEGKLGRSALYLPGFADAVRVHFNGQLLLDMGPLDAPPIRHWSSPVLIFIPENLVADENRIDIITSGFAQNGAGLFSFYFGPLAALQYPYYVRVFLTKIIGLVGLSFMVLSSFIFGVLYFARRQKKEYGWMAVGFTFATIFSSHYVLVYNPIPFHIWAPIWNLSLSVLAFCNFKFLQHLLGGNPRRSERYYVIHFFAYIPIYIVTPAEYVNIVSIGLHLATFVITLHILMILFAQRQRFNRSGFPVVFLIHNIATMVVIHDYIFFYWRPWLTNVQIGQIGILLMIGMTLWMVLSDLILSLRGVEAMNLSLQAKTDAVTKSLAESYEKLAVVEKQNVLNIERKRIMLDLHDGVGGQLVNTIAYLKNKNVDDPTLEQALETALRDLSLMIDSLESHDSLTTSLGMLRQRLEPLLETTGLKFKWDVWDEPVAGQLGPTQILNTLRIAQEAITNAVKHSKATTITVATTTTSLIISDNGIGIPDLPRPGRDGVNTGLGLTGMQRRAKSLGGALNIDSTTCGTKLTIDFSLLQDANG